MELKLASQLITLVVTNGFNRTFMELKFTENVSTLLSTKFQSYLYGIEINNNHKERSALYCFNRTFMELKLNRSLRAIPLTLPFQSYLYGIEIKNRILKLNN